LKGSNLGRNRHLDLTKGGKVRLKKRGVTKKRFNHMRGGGLVKRVLGGGGAVDGGG